MANTFASAPIPDPNDYTAGQDILASEWRALTGAINYVHAHMYAQPVIAQGWVAPSGATSQVLRAGAAKADIAEWAIPRLTTKHAQVKCEVYARGGAVNGGTVYFYNSATGNEKQVVVAAGGPAYASNTLTVDTTKTTTRIVMRIGAVGGTVAVDDVSVSYVALTSPLATSKAGNFEPHGEVAQGADYTLSAERGYRVATNLRDFRPRVRALMNISGITTTNITGAANKQACSPYLPGNFRMRQYVTTHMGKLGIGGTDYQLYVKVNPHSTDTSYIRVITSLTPDFVNAEEIDTQVLEVAPAVSGATWKTMSFRFPEGYAIPGVAYPTVAIGISNYGWIGQTYPPEWANDSSTTARILSMLIYGE